MKKTTIFAFLLPFLIFIPAVLAAVGLPSASGPATIGGTISSLWQGIVNLLGKQEYTKEGIEAILRFVLMIIFYIIIDNVLKHTIGGESKLGENKKILKKESVLVISIAAALLTALLIPFELIIKGFSIILISFLAFLLLDSVKNILTEDKKEFKSVAKAFAFLVFAGLFRQYFLERLDKIAIGTVNITAWAGSIETIVLLQNIGTYAFLVLGGLFLITLATYMIKNWPKSEPAKTETELEQAEKASAKETESGKTRRVVATTTLKRQLQVLKDGILGIVSLLNKLHDQIEKEQINDAAKTLSAEKTMLKQLAAGEATLPKIEFEKGTVPKRVAALIKEEESILDKITELQDMLNVYFSVISKAKTAGTAIPTADKDNATILISKKIIPLLNALYALNKNEEIS